MNNYLIAYGVYTPVIIGLTIWVARTMHKNTKAFLNDIFKGNDPVAASVNNLLQVGFYLVALGFGFLKLRIHAYPYSNQWAQDIFTTREMVETLAVKLGGFTLFIGFMLFLNLFLMLLLRKGHNRQQPTPRPFQQNI